MKLMRKIWFYFRLAIVLLSLSGLWLYFNPIADPDGNHEITLLSFNVYGFSDGWNQGRLSDLLTGIASTESDILFLQEFPAGLDHGLAVKLFQDQLQLPHWQFYPYDQTGRVGMAVFSRYPIVEQGFVLLPPLNEGRGLGRAVVDVDGSLLELGVVHMPNSDIHRDGNRGSLSREIIGPNLRTIQVDGLLRLLGEQAHARVIAGDFNTFTLSAAWRGMRSQYHDAFRIPENFHGTFRLRRDIEVKIDHIFLSKSVKALEAKVLDIAGSDHRPVYARIRF
jgi:endonuclease/exonuclease/phosphatase family metal-dependent hydrolase